MATLTQVWAEIDEEVEVVEQGVPLAILNDFATESGLRYADIYEVVLPARTLKHRKARNEPLSLDESDKLARLVRVFKQAVQVYGDNERAVRWLGTPKKAFSERTPIQMLRTEVGGRKVEELLIQIDEGMFV